MAREQTNANKGGAARQVCCPFPPVRGVNPTSGMVVVDAIEISESWLRFGG